MIILNKNAAKNGYPDKPNKPNKTGQMYTFINLKLHISVINGTLLSCDEKVTIYS